MLLLSKVLDRKPVRGRALQAISGTHEIKKVAIYLQVTNKVRIFAADY